MGMAHRQLSRTRSFSKCWENTRFVKFHFGSKFLEDAQYFVYEFKWWGYKEQL